ncbi:hypothetical protein [Corallococcus exiguus]|uniref:Calcineurin-like phosphoesterase domain-containing protein n=1 Tax=Corallococcus exiguus TaxID=83462 RepID=A0A7X4YFF5_9BACT|nr:hypothetical protein [Corallococcus exiguus]NBC44435.1 hypothetical protein [Corallococcus exiguus]TNV62239.1 hypothetical protein FH620_18645 [Corallococcus exiguus]
MALQAGHPGGGAPIQKPRGVIINGDLTAYWFDWQVDLFERYYTLPGTLRWPLFIGLGNHDYANNLGDGWWLEPPYYLTPGDNGAAANARDFIVHRLAEEGPGRCDSRGPQDHPQPA